MKYRATHSLWKYLNSRISSRNSHVLKLNLLLLVKDTYHNFLNIISIHTPLRSALLNSKQYRSFCWSSVCTKSWWSIQTIWRSKCIYCSTQKVWKFFPIYVRSRIYPLINKTNTIFYLKYFVKFVYAPAFMFLLPLKVMTHTYLNTTNIYENKYKLKFLHTTTRV